MNLKIPRSMLVAGYLFLLPAASGAQHPVLVLGDGAEVMDRLVVGEDLWVDLQGGLPDATYEIRLTSSSGEPIASLPSVPTAAGTGTQPAPGRGNLLWARSGVRDCDCGSEIPKSFRFLDFAEAEAALGGMELRVEALDAQGIVVASVPLQAILPQPGRSYFSDAIGCPRAAYAPGEQIWVSLVSPFFLGAPARTLVLSVNFDDPSDDVRGSAQELLLPAQGGRAILEVEMAGLVGAGPFYGFLSYAGSGGTAVSQTVEAGPGPLWRVTANKGNGLPNGGIVITLDGCMPSPP